MKCFISHFSTVLIAEFQLSKYYLWSKEQASAKNGQSLGSMLQKLFLHGSMFCALSFSQLNKFCL